jgi:hypothetical protein
MDILAKVDTAQALAQLKAYRDEGAGRVFSFFKGRHTTFAVFFAVTGFILALLGKLTAQYVSLIVALQAYVLAHSYKEGQEESQQRGPTS